MSKYIVGFANPGLENLFGDVGRDVFKSVDVMDYKQSRVARDAFRRVYSTNYISLQKTLTEKTKEFDIDGAGRFVCDSTRFGTIVGSAIGIARGNKKPGEEETDINKRIHLQVISFWPGYIPGRTTKTNLDTIGNPIADGNPGWDIPYERVLDIAEDTWGETENPHPIVYVSETECGKCASAKNYNTQIDSAKDTILVDTCDTISVLWPDDLTLTNTKTNKKEQVSFIDAAKSDIGAYRGCDCIDVLYKIRAKNELEPNACSIDIVPCHLDRETHTVGIRALTDSEKQTLASVPNLPLWTPKKRPEIPDFAVEQNEIELTEPDR